MLNKGLRLIEIIVVFGEEKRMAAKDKPQNWQGISRYLRSMKLIVMMISQGVFDFSEQGTNTSKNC